MMLDGDVQQPGLERREAEELQVDREEHEEPVEPGVDEEGLRVRHREVPDPEELEREHRLCDPLLDDDERRERGHCAHEGPPDRAEAAVGALDEPVGEEPEARGRQGRSGEVEPALALGRGLVTAPHESQHDGRGGERQVEEEDPAPGDPLDERAAGGGSRDRGDARERRPQPDGTSGFGTVDAAEKREGVRGQERAGDALERPRDDECGLVRRGAREQGGDCEAGRARDEDPAAAVAVPDRAADEVQGRERQRVGEEDPLLACQAEPEILLDGRERHDDHRRVDERQRRPEDGGGEGQPSPRIEAERLHGRRIR